MTPPYTIYIYFFVPIFATILPANFYDTFAGMKNHRAKKKAVAAIRKIVNAAQELAKAEQSYFNRKPQAVFETLSKRKPTFLSAEAADGD